MKFTPFYVALLSATLLLTSCVRVFPEGGAPDEIVLLTPTLRPEQIQGQPVSWQLLVADPATEAQYDTDRIAVLNNHFEIDYMADMVWAASLPTVLQSFLIQEFEDSHKIMGVGKADSGIAARYILRTEIRDFQLDASHEKDGLIVHLTLSVKLLDLKNNRIVGFHVLEQKIPLSARDSGSLLRAFNTGLNALGAELVQWVLITGQKEI